MKTPTQIQKLELCNSRASQLLVVDVQERLCNAMPQECLAAALKNTTRLLDAANALEIPVIITEQYPEGLGATLPEVGSHLPPGVAPIEKTSFSCCSAPGFEGRLVKQEERHQVILVGIETHICILQTAAGLQHWGYRVFVAADTVCSRSPAIRENALHRMRQGGIIVTNTESVVFEWMGDARHPKFKDISRMFR
ncbi:MAG: hydrolase [Chromatiales bacterium]